MRLRSAIQGCDYMNDLQNFNNFTMLKFFNLEEKNISNFKVYLKDTVLNIDVTLNQKDEVCPHCGYNHYTIKDYVQKKLIHSTFTNQKCVINYRARRYKCGLCAKTFYEHNPFAFNGMKLTMNTVYNVLSDLRKVTETFSSVALRYHLSTTSVISIFDKYVDISRGVLSEVLCIDEVYAFKSKKRKYVCVLLDFKTQEIIDLLPSRRKMDLSNYFYNIPKEERLRVKIVSMDMWHTYRDITQVYFPNAVCAIDKFHIFQEFGRRLTRIRIKAMNKYEDKGVKNDPTLSQLEKSRIYQKEINYYLLKKFHWLLFKVGDDAPQPSGGRRYNKKLKGKYNLFELRQMMFDANPELLDAFNAHFLLHKFFQSNYEEAKVKFIELIEFFKKSQSIEIVDFVNTLLQWKKEIINSFIVIEGHGKISNAIIENRNKAIKTIKRNSNGFVNWGRFRNRVMVVVNPNATHYLYPIKKD